MKTTFVSLQITFDELKKMLLWYMEQLDYEDLKDFEVDGIYENSDRTFTVNFERKSEEV